MQQGYAKMQTQHFFTLPKWDLNPQPPDHHSIDCINEQSPTCEVVHETKLTSKFPAKQIPA